MLVLALAAVVIVVVRPGPVAGWFGERPTAPSPAARPPEPSPSPVLLAAADAPAPTPDGVSAVIDQLIKGAHLGGTLGVSIVDAATGQSLYDQGADALTTPASTTKLVTAATVLAARGPVYRIPTRVVAGANPGEVVIIGGGDPTLAVNAVGTYPGAARLDKLAAQVKKALGGTAPTKVIVDSTLFTGPVHGPGWDADIPTGGFASAITALMTDGARVDPKDTEQAQRYPDPDLAAGRVFAKLLKLPASAVGRGTAPEAPAGGAPSGGANGTEGEPAPTGTGSEGADGSAAAPPEPGRELGRVESPPLLRLVEYMLQASDNVIAESLARQVALAKGKPASYQGASAAMDETLAELGLPADKSGLVDGSGLSRKDRLTPSLLTDLLVLVASGRHPELSGVLSGLPVAGWSGTLEDRFQATSGSGKAGVGAVRAKTGTLSGVNAMAGTVRTADGSTLVFALVAAGVTAGQWDAQAALDAMAAALAGCGCG